MKHNFISTRPPTPWVSGSLEVSLQPGHRCLECGAELKPHNIVKTAVGSVLDCSRCGTRFLEVTDLWKEFFRGSNAEWED